MLFTETTFIGIDPSAGLRPFVYAAIDHSRDILVLESGRLEDVLAFAAGQRQALVAVCAPRRPNQGLMSRDEIRQRLQPQPLPGRWMDFRMAEYQLWRHNIRIPQTRSQEVDCPNWMRMSFKLFSRLEKIGYMSYPHEDAVCQVMEVYPHACYTVLLGVLPFPKHSLEGRLQRQLLLFDQDVDVPDPMRYFEEITRYRLLKSILPEENLYTLEELDALVGAYSAWLAAFHPERITLFGDPQEGQVVVPAVDLIAKY